MNAPKGENELWRNASKNAPRLDLLTHFPTATTPRGDFRRGFVTIGMQFRQKKKIKM